MKITAVIPSYKNPKYLDLCLESAIKTKKLDSTEILVVIDGYPDLSNDVINKYSQHINSIQFPDNQGMASAINHGVYNASNEYILVVSEDNIFPDGWDEILGEYTSDSYKIISPNQIEPSGPSMYKFKFHDFGRDIESFNLSNFIEQEKNFKENKLTEDGSTFPFMIEKLKFLSVGGFDISYPSPFVVDWDFFLKLELLNDTRLVRLHSLNFYHFVSKSTKNRNGYIESPDEVAEFFKGEKDAQEYFKYKWGFLPKRDINNKCLPFMEDK